MEAFIRERSACLCLPALCLVIVWPRLFLFPLFLFSRPLLLLLLLTLSCFVYYYPCSSIFPLNPKFQLDLLDLIVSRGYLNYSIIFLLRTLFLNFSLLSSFRRISLFLHFLPAIESYPTFLHLFIRLKSFRVKFLKRKIHQKTLFFNHSVDLIVSNRLYLIFLSLHRIELNFLT